MTAFSGQTSTLLRNAVHSDGNNSGKDPSPSTIRSCGLKSNKVPATGLLCSIPCILSACISGRYDLCAKYTSTFVSITASGKIIPMSRRRSHQKSFSGVHTSTYMLEGTEVSATSSK